MANASKSQPQEKLSLKISPSPKREKPLREEKHQCVTALYKCNQPPQILSISWWMPCQFTLSPEKENTPVTNIWQYFPMLLVSSSQEQIYGKQTKCPWMFNGIQSWGEHKHLAYYRTRLFSQLLNITKVRNLLIYTKWWPAFLELCGILSNSRVFLIYSCHCKRLCYACAFFFFPQNVYQSNIKQRTFAMGDILPSWP